MVRRKTSARISNPNELRSSVMRHHRRKMPRQYTVYGLDHFLGAYALAVFSFSGNNSDAYSVYGSIHGACCIHPIPCSGLHSLVHSSYWSAWRWGYEVSLSHSRWNTMILLFGILFVLAFWLLWHSVMMHPIASYCTIQKSNTIRWYNHPISSSNVIKQYHHIHSLYLLYCTVASFVALMFWYVTSHDTHENCVALDCRAFLTPIFLLSVHDDSWIIRGSSRTLVTSHPGEGRSSGVLVTLAIVSHLDENLDSPLKGWKIWRLWWWNHIGLSRMLLEMQRRFLLLCGVCQGHLDLLQGPIIQHSQALDGRQNLRMKPPGLNCSASFCWQWGNPDVL